MGNNYSIVNFNHLESVIRNVGRIDAKSTRHIIFGVLFAWYAIGRMNLQDKEIKKLKKKLKELKVEVDNKENLMNDD